MKNFVLHCHRYPVVTRFFTLEPWNKVDKPKKIFLSEPAKFFALDQFGRNSPTV